jgi:hypothetical protein
MIIWGFIILGVVLMIIGASNDKLGDSFIPTGFSFFIIFLIIYVIILLSVIPIPAKYTSLHITLQKQYEYIKKLPDVPVSVSQDKVTAGSINVDLPNMQIAKDIIKEKIDFWNEVESYNEGIAMWRQHHIDVIVWGFPRIGKTIAQLPLIGDGGN